MNLFEGTRSPRCHFKRESPWSPERQSHQTRNFAMVPNSRAKAHGRLSFATGYANSPVHKAGAEDAMLLTASELSASRVELPLREGVGVVRAEERFLSMEPSRRCPIPQRPSIPTNHGGQTLQIMTATGSRGYLARPILDLSGARALGTCDLSGSALPSRFSPSRRSPRRGPSPSRAPHGASSGTA